MTETCSKIADWINQARSIKERTCRVPNFHQSRFQEAKQESEETTNWFKSPLKRAFKHTKSKTSLRLASSKTSTWKIRIQSKAFRALHKVWPKPSLFIIKHSTGEASHQSCMITKAIIKQICIWAICSSRDQGWILWKNLIQSQSLRYLTKKLNPFQVNHFSETCNKQEAKIDRNLFCLAMDKKHTLNWNFWRTRLDRNLL